MRHYPVFLDLRGRRIAVAGAGAVAEAKLRLLMKTEAEIVVAGLRPTAAVRAWAAEGRIVLRERELSPEDAAGAALVYGATGDAEADARAAAIGRALGALVNVVDDLEGSDFITPAIVDRDPVTVAIGTEGAAPVLARKIKAEVEALLPSTLGLLTRIGQGFRARVEALDSKARRGFWTRFAFWKELQLIFQMYFDPRYRLSRVCQIGVPVILSLMVVNYFLLGQWFPLIGFLLERIALVILAVALYKLLAWESTRYAAVLRYLTQYGR